ncbi:MAG: twin-arginine translocation signal domain-containing protein, partial [Thermoguttaceae bacterium]|nr:twin-arginine translocation signal domain-containing protein [Thermoguttaceae bacterium]
MTVSRRNFLKTGALAGVALSMAMPRVHAGED